MENQNSSMLAELMLLNEAPDSAIVDTRLAGIFLGLSHGTLEVWRSTRRVNIPHLKMGRSVRYKLGDLREYQNSCRAEG